MTRTRIPGPSCAAPGSRPPPATPGSSRSCARSPRRVAFARAGRGCSRRWATACSTTPAPTASSWTASFPTIPWCSRAGRVTWRSSTARRSGRSGSATTRRTRRVATTDGCRDRRCWAGGCRGTRGGGAARGAPAGAPAAGGPPPGAAMRRPYADRPGWYGELDFPPETLAAVIRETLAAREQLLVHAVGDSAIAVLLRLLSGAAPDSIWHAQRPRIEHGDFLTPDLLPSARRLGVVVVQNPTHFATPDLIRRRFGPGRSGAAQPLRSLLGAGIPIALGSDGPMNPYLNIMLAVTHPVNPGEALDREQAVLAYTRGPANAEV